MLLVTPGIRWEGQSADDQKRVMDPIAALQAGSSYLVMGRSLLRETNKLKTLDNWIHQLKATFVA
jgi:orotidine-5'-phosphate decarboxylase